MKKDFSRSFLWHKVKSTCIQGCFNSQHLSQGSLQLFPSLTSFCLNLSFRMLRLMFMSISSNAILVGFFFFSSLLDPWGVENFRKKDGVAVTVVSPHATEGRSLCLFYPVSSSAKRQYWHCLLNRTTVKSSNNRKHFSPLHSVTVLPTTKLYFFFFCSSLSASALSACDAL